MRSPLLALVKKDVRGYFDQPTAYILIVPFVAVLAYVYFNSGILSGEASLRPIFTVEFSIWPPSLPWLLAIFVPAATMRLLAEENRDGTLEMLFTYPIRGWIVLLSKFLAGIIFVGFMIFATIGIPVAVQTAGDLDVGATIAQYAGSLLLAASFVSIGLFTSSLTRNQIVAFILGLAVTMALMIMGHDNVAVTLPPRLATLLQDLSPVTHFSSMARGVIHLRDVLYFIALASTFLSATFLTVRGRTLSHRSAQYRNLQLGVAGLIVVSLLVGWSSTAIGGRIDLTDDKLFTMSPATADILDGLDDILTVELFRTKEEPPVQLSSATRDVSDFLDDFADSSGGKVNLVLRFPDDDEDDARKAQLAGIVPRQFNIQSRGALQIKVGFLGVALTFVDQREVIPFVGSIEGFEYRLASLANKMVLQQKKTVGFLTGHGELTASQGYSSFAGLLSAAYEVIEIDATEDAPPDLSNVDVLIIAGPDQPIPDQVVDELRAYIDAGGKAMVMINSAQIDQANMAAQPNANSFAHFVEEYGVRVEDDLVFDLNSNETLPFTSQGGSVLISYPFWMRVRVIDTEVTGNVRSALLPWASSIGILEDVRSRIDVVTLLETTQFAAIDFAYGDIGPNATIFRDVTEANQVESLMAVAVSQRADDSDSASLFRLVVVGSSGWLSDLITARADENLVLGLNFVDWLAQEDALAAIRSKVVTERRLLFSSDTHENISRWANVAGVPALLVVLGLVRSLRRRRFGSARYGQTAGPQGGNRLTKRGRSRRDSGGQDQ
jgi:ABC-2 type transport system permease protein